MIRSINGYSLEDCHRQLLALIAKTCYRDRRTNKPIVFPGENQQATIEAPEFVIHCATPTADNMYVAAFPTIGSRAFLDQYAHDLVHGRENPASEFVYDYNDRLRHWGGDFLSCDGSVGIDQVGYIINKLHKSPVTRRAIGITWIPSIDPNRDDVPCLQTIMCNVRNDSVNMSVVFRSEDMVAGAGPNMYGLVKLQSYIADCLNLPVGTYTHFVQCPHIYTRDFDLLRSVGIEVPYV